MEWHSRLQARDDVNNEDIAEILERAETMRQQLEYASNTQLNPGDVTRLGDELDIPVELIQQAIDELRRERQAARSQAAVEAMHRAKQQARLWAGLTTVVGWGLGLIVILVLGLFVMRWFQSLPPPVQEHTIIQQTVIEAPVVKPVKPDPSKTTITNAMTDLPSRDDVAVFDRIPDPASKPVVDHVEEAPAVSQGSTLVFPSIDAVIEEAEAVVADVQVAPAVEPAASESLSVVVRALEGEWILDAYWLYEKGGTRPTEVPVVYEPLEVPKTWRFTNGRYKRVMDKSLSFSAAYEVVTWPEKNKPTSIVEGQWGQIVASNVVSTIPGIRRQNDYFAILVSRDTLTVWYLGPNADRKKLPSQAEHYVRR